MTEQYWYDGALPFDAADWIERLHNVGGKVNAGVSFRASGEIWKTGTMWDDRLGLTIDPTDERQWEIAEEVRGVANAGAEIRAALEGWRAHEAVAWKLGMLRFVVESAAAKPEDRMAQDAAISTRDALVADLRAAGVREAIIEMALKGGEA